MSSYVCKGAEWVHVSEPAELVYMSAFALNLYCGCMCASEYTHSVAHNVFVWKHVRDIHLWNARCDCQCKGLSVSGWGQCIQVQKCV